MSLCFSPHSWMPRAAWALACVLALHHAGHAAEASAAQQATFQNYNSCPSTGRRSGACPGYLIAWRVPPCVGGQDRWTNMQWLTEAAAREKLRRDAAAC